LILSGPISRQVGLLDELKKIKALLAMGQRVDRDIRIDEKHKLTRMGKQVISNRSPTIRQRDQAMLDLLIKNVGNSVERTNRLDLNHPTKSPETKPDNFESGDTAMNPSLTRVQQTRQIDMTPIRSLSRSPATKRLLTDGDGNQATVRQSALRKLYLTSSRTYSGANELQRLTAEFPTIPTREFDGFQIKDKSQNYLKRSTAKPSTIVTRNRMASANSICVSTSHTRKLNAAMDGATFNKFLRNHRKNPQKKHDKNTPTKCSPKKANFSTINFDSVENYRGLYHQDDNQQAQRQSNPGVTTIQTSTMELWRADVKEHIPQPCEFELLSDVFGSKSMMFKTEFYNPMPPEVKKKLGLIHSPLSKTRRSVSHARKVIDKNF